MPAREPVRPLELIGLGLFALALRLAMVWAIPAAGGRPYRNCAPDEPAHFAIVRALASGRAPTWPDETSSIYGAFLPTPYFAQALSLAVAGDLPATERTASSHPAAREYGAARLGSALLGALAVVALAAAAGILACQRGATLSVGLAAACYPQLVLLGAYVNADAFTLCAGAFYALALARWARRGEGEEGLKALGAAGGVVALGQLSGYYLVPATVPWLAWALWRGRMRARALVGPLLAFLLVLGPFLVWNVRRNGGDALGLGRYHRFLLAVRDGPHIRAPERFSAFLASFGKFTDLPLGWPFYLFAALFLASGLSMAVAALRHASGTARRAAFFLGTAVLANLALTVNLYSFVDFSPSGGSLLLSAIFLTGVAVAVPRNVLSARLGLAFTVAYLLFLFAAAVEAQVLVDPHPCLPG
ncbi:MAG TPA: glycosyltransferase family 39 protein [Anaeromyxobacteraceae bacterium]|nr:glycosyltransferase family 39 protein [Anaeromyxobacteraceae bacterium]